MGDNAINSSMQQFYDGMKQGCVDILSSIDTLEVKEVDLNKEIDIAMPSKYCWSGDGKAVYSKEQMRNFAKLFFELGIKAQKEE